LKSEGTALQKEFNSFLNLNMYHSNRGPLEYYFNHSAHRELFLNYFTKANDFSPLKYCVLVILVSIKELLKRHALQLSNHSATFQFMVLSFKMLR
jgi:hypothetical protein